MKLENEIMEQVLDKQITARALLIIRELRKLDITITAELIRYVTHRVYANMAINRLNATPKGSIKKFPPPVPSPQGGPSTGGADLLSKQEKPQ